MQWPEPLYKFPFAEHVFGASSSSSSNPTVIPAINMLHDEYVCAEAAIVWATSMDNCEVLTSWLLSEPHRMLEINSPYINVLLPLPDFCRNNGFCTSCCSGYCCSNPLCHFAFHGNFVSDRHINVNGHPLLHLATFYASYDAMRLLIHYAGADVNAKCLQCTSTPLSVAIMSRNVKAAKLLIVEGNASLKDDEMQRQAFGGIVHYAIKGMDYFMLHLLLKHGANPDAIDERGDSALQRASLHAYEDRNGQKCNVDMFLELCQYGASGDAGNTPLQSNGTLLSILPEIMDTGNVSVVQALIRSVHESGKERAKKMMLLGVDNDVDDDYNFSQMIDRDPSLYIHYSVQETFMNMVSVYMISKKAYFCLRRRRKIMDCLQVVLQSGLMQLQHFIEECDWVRHHDTTGRALLAVIPFISAEHVFQMYSSLVREMGKRRHRIAEERFVFFKLCVYFQRIFGDLHTHILYCCYFEKTQFSIGNILSDAFYAAKHENATGSYARFIMPKKYCMRLGEIVACGIFHLHLNCREDLHNILMGTEEELVHEAISGNDGPKYHGMSRRNMRIKVLAAMNIHHESPAFLEHAISTALNHLQGYVQDVMENEHLQPGLADAFVCGIRKVTHLMLSHSIPTDIRQLLLYSVGCVCSREGFATDLERQCMVRGQTQTKKTRYHFRHPLTAKRGLFYDCDPRQRQRQLFAFEEAKLTRLFAQPKVEILFDGMGCNGVDSGSGTETEDMQPQQQGEYCFNALAQIG